MADTSGFESILADLIKSRKVLENSLKDKEGVNSTAEILLKLKELRRRADETNALIEIVDRRQGHR
ncbi:MAG TPA: hypothetical protein VNM92_08460 [Thermoanaerobaculia bacterium]|nr:hypothetical protein [Thermoanaerobaculia bacterium]